MPVQFMNKHTCFIACQFLLGCTNQKVNFDFIFYGNKPFRLAIQRLEIAKSDLQNRIAKEVWEETSHPLAPFYLSSSSHLIESVSQARGNAILQASLERRKQALHERRLALEQDVCCIPLLYYFLLGSCVIMF